MEVDTKFTLIELHCFQMVMEKFMIYTNNSFIFKHMAVLSTYQRLISCTHRHFQIQCMDKIDMIGLHCVYLVFTSPVINVLIFIVSFNNLQLFQVYDLQYASPATISRCGMVYVDPKNLGYEPYWKKWVAQRLTAFEVEELNRYFEKYVVALIELVVEGIEGGRQVEKMKPIIPQTNLNMVGTLYVKYFMECLYFDIWSMFSFMRSVL